MKTRPFRDGDTHATFRNLTDKVVQEIASLDNEYVLKASKIELEDHFLDKSKVSPLVLHSSEYYIENREGTKIDVSRDFNRAIFPGERAQVSGTKIDIAIPYEGDPYSWRLRPSSILLSAFPELEIRDDVIIFSLRFADDTVNPVQIKSDIEKTVSNLQDTAKNLQRDIENHNNAVIQTVRSAIERKLTKANATIAAIVDLGIPMKKRDTPLTYTVPTKRRPSPKHLPKVQTERYKPEPVLAEYDYNHIIGVLKSMSLVIERNPKSFSGLGEEDIRNHFLIQLNGHYDGSATGETFNASGKTDILIRVEDRNIFIAECKFWRGQKKFSEAIDQLLGYLSWRDTKSALLIFNTNRDSSSVRLKMNDVLKGRTENRKTRYLDKDGESRYIFVKESDPGREIVIATLLFDLPK
jgi:hypothetical protein